MRRVALAVALLLLAAAPGRADGPSPDELRRAAEAARTPAELDRAVAAAMARIGKEPGFADAGAFADWLALLPPDRLADAAVARRRGWALVAAKRGAEAVAALEPYLATHADDALARAYYADALRLAGKPADALRELAAAVAAGHRGETVAASALRAAYELRTATPPQDATGLPAYAEALDAFLAVLPDAATSATLATWVLADRAAFAPKDDPRSRSWAELAGRHALRALRAEPGLDGGARLAFDAATALEAADLEHGGKTDRFDLLATAVRIADRPEREGHDLPQAVARLAEAALREGRFELAAAMARKRLALSDSPAARRVLDACPPDVGD